MQTYIKFLRILHQLDKNILFIEETHLMGRTNTLPTVTLQRHTRRASVRLSIHAKYFLESYVYT